jgi:hypothetical protein
MLIPNQQVEVRWVGYTKKYYISKGYPFTKINDFFYVDIKDLPLKSNMYVRFICDYCNGENQIEEKDKYAKYSNLNNHRKKINKDCCRNCSGKKLSESFRSKKIPKGESLAEKYPEIAKEWVYEKNEKTPWDYHHGSNFKEMWWRCENGHEYKATIYDRTYENRHAGCPYCLGKIITSENCLFATHPELASQWHPTKNGDLTPYNCSAKSGKIVWWIGECGHVYDQSISNRVIRGLSCPFCHGMRVCEDNCLLNVNPEISKEWHPTRNGGLTPYDVTYGTSREVWWKCERCGHDYQCSVAARTYSGRSCPQCKESKGEKKIRKILKNKNINNDSQIEFIGLVGVGGRPLKFDFGLYMNDLLVCIVEYDGGFHFMKVYEEHIYEYTVEHDKRKNTYCAENNIPLIRIPYWESKNIEFILEHILGYFKLINKDNVDESFVNSFLVNHSDWSEEKYQQEFQLKGN